MDSIDFGRWRELIKDPLWYAMDEFWPLIEGLFVNPALLTSEQKDLKGKMLSFFTAHLERGQVALGDRVEFFNDDDRWTPEDGWKVHIDTVIIHHTAMSPLVMYRTLNAMGLLRLYCPIYKNSKAFQVNGELQPISSGHFYSGLQTFVGYHHCVYNYGSLTGLSAQYLSDRYTGFQSGDYALNCRSIGIAIRGDLTNEIPKGETIDAINEIIALYPDVKTIIGHQEVPRKDGKTTDCPGNRWNEWKYHLRLPSQ